MQRKGRSLWILLLIAAGLAFFWFRDRQIHKRPAASPETPFIVKKEPPPRKHASGNPQFQAIDELTSERVVIPYLKQNGKLPPCYIKKSTARKKGWVASKGNLCQVLPGKAIGGDVFSNRQKLLPVMSGRTWFEADLNYNCGKRNADRILFSNDGLIFVTKDHYKTFEEK